jgi:hypothetical protein
MIGLSPGKCRDCEEPVSHFARTCPSCGAANLPNPVATIAGLAAVILLGGLIVLGLQAFRSKGTPATPPRADGEPPPPQTAGDSDYGWIVKAMAECEEEAKIKLDTMNFLIVPVTPSGTPLPGWSPNPISAVGDSGVLLTSTDTLIGLRNRALVLYEKPIAFAVSDPTSKTVYKWNPATGVTALKSRQTDQASLTLGFEIPEVGKEIEWGPTINLSRGTCYWINPLISVGKR